MAAVKTGLIQLALKGDAEDSPEAIRERMLEAHVPFIEEAAAVGVQVLCFQEVFNQPYFCPSQDPKVVCGGRADPGRPDHAAHVRVRAQARHGHRRAHLRAGDDRGLLQHRRGH